jgi:signal transduction histidine kinase
MEYPLDQRRTIWVVDDSPTDAERVRRLLSDAHDVSVISDGAAALERLSGGQAPDLLLLDWVMPGMTGLEVCQYLRALPAPLSQIPVILLTARYGAQEVEQAFRSGANDYVSKPFINEELLARVASLLQAKRLLRRAEKAEDDVRSLLSNAPDSIFAVDAQGIVTFANEEGLRMLQKPSAEVIGASFIELMPGISQGNFRVGPGESALAVPDVRVRDRVYSPSIRALPSDSAATTTVVMRDVTARRKADTRRLDFYSVIAHDLRTPITSILLRLEMTFRGKHGVLPAGHLSDLRKTETSLRSLMGMINDFLELARLEGVGYKIERKALDLDDLVKHTVEDFRPLLEKNGLAWTHDGSTAPVTGDRQRLMQVVANLVGNAIKFTAAGSISTAVLTTSGYVEFSVTDTGRGIEAEEIPGLFERYARSPDVTRETSGTGLGLMIVRELVEAHSGVIGAESSIGKGSKFWFRLPRS